VPLDRFWSSVEGELAESIGKLVDDSLREEGWIGDKGT